MKYSLTERVKYQIASSLCLIQVLITCNPILDPFPYSRFLRSLASYAIFWVNPLLAARKMMSKNQLYYADYLQLDKILSAQKPQSLQQGHMAHDEFFFIILHQTYELWFKEILFELDSVCAQLNPKPTEQALYQMHHRINRIIAVFKLLLEQLALLKTLSPTAFMEFRDLLAPASGFQSIQFRIIETRLGVTVDEQMFQIYLQHLHPVQQKELIAAKNKDSLFVLIEKWLAQMPVAKTSKHDFLSAYQQAVQSYLNIQKNKIIKHRQLNNKQKESELNKLALDDAHFAQLFDQKKYEQLIAPGARRLSYSALINTLFLNLYHDVPALTMPYQILVDIIELDELLTQWRVEHVLMVHRMIGIKTGTIGSLGYAYLKGTIDKYRVFSEMSSVTTYLLPKPFVPPLASNEATRIAQSLYKKR